ncbi:MAG: SMP-30/gluconolactonase/LRE family protein [Saprospiraceae bacterium]|nr:SMP-30/gluconolactonase/LRE family protein [Saprospiraceae bacterium]
MKNIITTLFFVTLAACTGTKRFTASDLTPEGSFSENCEGPNVDKAGNLYVVNYQRDGTVGIVTPDGKASVFVELPTGSTANAIRFDSKGDMLLADFTGHNVLKINHSTKKVTVFCHDDRFNQPNDLCITKGDVVFTSDPKWKDGTGQVWRIMPDGKASIAAGNMGTTNGIELSPDERTLYVNESGQLNIWAFDVSLTGELSNKRLFHKFDDHGMDGMKCDKVGNLYVTRYGKGVVAVLSPNGKLLREVSLKGKKTSNLAFGGKDGKTVYVTLQDRKCVETFRNDVAGKGY